MSFLNPGPPLPPPPPPTFTTAIIYGNDSSSSPSPSASTSYIIIIIVIASAIIASATIYLLLRRRRWTLRTFFSTSSPVEDVVLPNFTVTNSSVVESLPLFTFGSINGNFAGGGDCAICLSKFQKDDQLRILPCCHAFHASCIGTWLLSNLTCPLCRFTVEAPVASVGVEILDGNSSRSGSFRVEIGSASRRRDSGDDRRSYPVGTFHYIVDDAFEVPVGSVHQRGVSDCTSVDNDSVNIPVTGPPGDNVAADVAGNRSSWLRDYLDRLSSFSLSSGSMSLRSSGRFFTGSSRRSEVIIPIDDLEAHRQEEEITEFFSWLSQV